MSEGTVHGHGDAERQGRIEELQRVCILLTALWHAVDERMEALEGGEALRPAAADVRLALNHAAALIAATPTEEWADWVLHLLTALGGEAPGDNFRPVLENLQTEIATRLSEDSAHRAGGGAERSG